MEGERGEATRGEESPRGEERRRGGKRSEEAGGEVKRSEDGADWGRLTKPCFFLLILRINSQMLGCFGGEKRRTGSHTRRDWI